MIRTLLTGLMTTVFFGIALPYASAQTLTSGDTESPQSTAISTEEITPEQATELIAGMSDQDLRVFVMEQLRVMLANQEAEPTETPSFVDSLLMLWNAFSEPTLDAISKVPVLVEKEDEAISRFVASHGGAAGTWTLFGLMALIFAISYGVEIAARRQLNQSLQLEPEKDQRSLGKTLKYLFGRFVREIFGLIVFFVLIRLLSILLLSETQLTFAAPFFGYLVFMPRIGAALSRFILAPQRPDLRMVNLEDKWAGFLYRHTIGLFLVGALTFFVIDFNINNGIVAGETRIGFWLDSSVYLYIIFIAWRAREGLSSIMRGTDEDRTKFDEWVARAYPTYAIIVAAATWVLVQTMAGLNKVGLLLQGAHYVTMFWLLMAPALETAIRGMVRHLAPPMIGEGPVAEQAYLSNKRSMIHIGRVLVLGLAAVMIANAWEVPLIETAGASEGIGDNILAFLLTCVIGYLAYEGVSLWINRRLARERSVADEAGEAEAGDIGGAGASRLSTVLPLALVTAHVAIVVLFFLLAVGNLGIDITPLLAGAGVIGLAIGFGAQKLVADVVSGVFFLIDDAFRIGEYIEVDGIMGSVEKISIRSMQLRHHKGAVHTLPYGEIPRLTNFSRDWVIMKLKFHVPFDTDPEKVRKIFKKIGQEMMQDPLYKDDLLQPFKSQGVFDIDDVGMIIRGKFMAKPGKQFMARKEIYNRVHDAFEANGIQFARRQVRVEIPGLEESNLSEDEKTAVRSAAAAAAEAKLPGSDGAS